MLNVIRIDKDTRKMYNLYSLTTINTYAMQCARYRGTTNDEKVIEIICIDLKITLLFENVSYFEFRIEANIRLNTKNTK